MEQHADSAVGERVELTYELTGADMRQALKARAKASGSARRLRRFAVLGVAAFGGASVVPLVNGRGFDASSLVMAGILTVVVFVLQPWLTARQFHKLAARHGVYRASAEAGGVTIVNGGGSSQLNWTAAPHYAETPDLFVLLSGDKNVSCLTVLPKRGVREPGGVDALRALLDRHIRRV
ncbi:YcxB family protein [Streptomyces sp. NPDC052225]|uniref:YcxB family protein n=1 Tax=Streptomyces sp. NPDC052225 TaxID=3154949 RepID=UPI0034307D9D